MTVALYLVATLGLAVLMVVHESAVTTWPRA
jgi:hypothetical protein